MNEFALKYFQQIDGKDCWLAGMCAIGPITTTNAKDALRFLSEREAMQHPAWSHPTCLLDVAPAPSLNDDATE